LQASPRKINDPNSGRPSFLLTGGALASVTRTPPIEHPVDGRPYSFAGLDARHAGQEQPVVLSVLMPYRRHF
jgi:hypothetical protein